MAETDYSRAPIEEVEARLRVMAKTGPFFLPSSTLLSCVNRSDLLRALDELHRRERQVVGLRAAVGMKWLGFALWLIAAFLWGRWSA